MDNNGNEISDSQIVSPFGETMDQPDLTQPPVRPTMGNPRFSNGSLPDVTQQRRPLRIANPDELDDEDTEFNSIIENLRGD